MKKKKGTGIWHLLVGKKKGGILVRSDHQPNMLQKRWKHFWKFVIDDEDGWNGLRW
jgi:hypothetical protein